MFIKNRLIFIPALILLIGISGCSIGQSARTATESSPVPPSEQPYSPVVTGPLFPPYSDFLTLQYKDSGSRTWSKTYAQSQNSMNAPLAISIDNNQNVFVTGSISKYTDNGKLGGLAVVKYNSSGEELQEASYINTDPRGSAFARAAAVDNQGNIYVTGENSSASGGGEIITFKYSDSLKEVWEEQYQYPQNGNADSEDIAIDTSGNVYICGTVNIDDTHQNLLILKYDNNGQLLWSVTYGGSSADNITADKLAVDASGNVYVAGNIANGDSAPDYLTAKYSGEGKELWAATFNGPGNGYDIPHDLKLDSQGNVIVTGESEGSNGIRDFATVKYDSDGHRLWVSLYSGPDQAGGIPSAMSIDNNGNIYVTGEGLNSPNGSDYATIKYNRNGQQIWAVRYKGTGSGLNKASEIFVDVNGYIYITGNCWVNGQDSTWNTVKYDQDGNQLWAAKYEKVYFTDIPTGLVVDKGGDVIITGALSQWSPNNETSTPQTNVN